MVSNTAVSGGTNRAAHAEAERNHAHSRIREVEADQEGRMHELETKLDEQAVEAKKLRDASGRDKERIAELEQEAERARAQVRELEDDIHRQLATVQSLEDGDGDHKVWIGVLEAETKEYKGRILDLTATVEARDRDVAGLEAESDRLREELRRQTAALEDKTRAKLEADVRHAAERHDTRQRHASELDDLQQLLQAKDKGTAGLQAELKTKEAEAHRLEEQLHEKSGRLQTVEAEATSLKEQLEEMASQLRTNQADADRRAEQLREQSARLQAKNAEATALQGQLEEAASRLRSSEAEGERRAEQLRDQSAQLQTKEAEATDLHGQLEEMASRLRSSWEEAAKQAEQLRRQFVQLETKSDALRVLGDKARTLQRQIDEKTTEAHDAAARLDAASQERETLRQQLQVDAAVAGGLSADLATLQGTVVAFCTRTTGVELAPAVWMEIWSAVRELTTLPWGQYSTMFWQIEPTHGETRRAEIHDLQLLCLHLIAALRAGKWDSGALDLAVQLWNQLGTEQPLPVAALVMILASAVEGAASHKDNVLLLSIWQLGVFLKETFPQEPQLGHISDALGGELERSPWCRRVAQAIAADAVPQLCTDTDGQLYEENGLAVLAWARRPEFMAFELQTRRLWMFADVHVVFRMIGTTPGIIIPGTPGPIPCPRQSKRWWMTVYSLWQ